MDTLVVQHTAQDQAWQRAGRAGRTTPGTCYRLYTRAQFNRFKKSTIPEILRIHLATVILQLLQIGINVRQFDFLDQPPSEAIDAALYELFSLGALENDGTSIASPNKLLVADKKIKLSELGKKMAQFPLDPKYAKILQSSSTFQCLEEMLTIISMMSVESVYYTPVSKREEVNAIRGKFRSAHGDHITLLNVYREFSTISQANKRIWCQENYINMRKMVDVQNTRTQIAEICKNCNIELSSCGSNMDQVRRCLLMGLFTNIAQLHNDKRQYVLLRHKQTASIHPSSVLHGQSPPLVLFNDILKTNKCYLRQITSIEEKWIEELVPYYNKENFNYDIISSSI